MNYFKYFLNMINSTAYLVRNPKKLIKIIKTSMKTKKNINDSL